MSNKPPGFHPGAGRSAARLGGKVVALGYRLIGSRFEIAGKWWTVTSRPEWNFLYLETASGRCRVLPIQALVGLEGVAPSIEQHPEAEP